MNIWLFLVTKNLVENIEKSPNKSFLQNILSVLIIYFKMQMLTGFCNNNKNLNYLKHFLRNIAIDFSSTYHTVLQVLWKEDKELLLTTVTIIANSAASFNLTEWIFAIPILHLLNGQCSPSQSLDTVDWDHFATSKQYVYTYSTDYCDDIFMPPGISGVSTGIHLTGVCIYAKHCNIKWLQVIMLPFHYCSYFYTFN